MNQLLCRIFSVFAVVAIAGNTSSLLADNLLSQRVDIGSQAAVTGEGISVVGACDPDAECPDCCPADCCNYPAPSGDSQNEELFSLASSEGVNACYVGQASVLAMAQAGCPVGWGISAATPSCSNALLGEVFVHPSQAMMDCGGWINAGTSDGQGYPNLAISGGRFQILPHGTDPSITRGLLHGMISLSGSHVGAIGDGIFVSGEYSTVRIGRVRVQSDSFLGGNWLTGMHGFGVVDVYVDDTLVRSIDVGHSYRFIILTTEIVSVGQHVELRAYSDLGMRADSGAGTSVSGGIGNSAAGASYEVEALPPGTTTPLGVQSVSIDFGEGPEVIWNENE